LALPVRGAVHAHQTEFDPFQKSVLGSPGSRVAARLLPDTLTLAPLNLGPLRKVMFGGHGQQFDAQTKLSAFTVPGSTPITYVVPATAVKSALER